MAAAAGDPASAYRAGRDRAAGEAAREERRFGAVGLVRLAVFLAAAGLAVVAVLNRGGPSVFGVAALALVFLALLIWHEVIHRRLERARRSLAYYDRGLARLEDRWVEGGDDGARFRDDDHLYATDLELFGPGSLFHLLNATGTETGAATLASWLTTPAPAEEVRARQTSVRELAPALPLRHDLAIASAEARAALDSGALRAWLEAPPAPLPAWLGPAALGMAVANVGVTVAGLASLVSGGVVSLVYAVSVALALSVQRRVVAVLRAADLPGRELRRIARLLARLAGERFASPRLVELARVWGSSGRSPVAEIRRLELLLDLIDARRNQLFAPISGLLLVGTQLALGVERWRRRVGDAASAWLAAVGELEALASLATQAFEHPDDAYPEIGAPGAPLVAAGIAHPLLPVDRAIRNDLTLGGDIRLAVVSGSNMSGKTTLLKAVGANLGLGFAGGPVRAHRLATGPLCLGASLVLRDSLLEGRSRFYAEVLRLKEILALAGSGKPVLFLLDELLSGTNSHDRAIGARGLLLALLDRGAIGMVTTHDLALAEIAEQLAPRAVNWHFEDRLVDGRLEFDYRLRPGVVRRSNALELMRAVGIDLT